MSDLDRNQLLTDLELDEGFRSLVYDDGNGKPVTKGSALVGYPTIGIGWNLAGTPVSKDRARIILGWMVDDKIGSLAAALPWIADLDEPRRRALSNMAYNLGVTGLLKFTTFLSHMQAGRYDDAADSLESTAWWKQVGQRGPRIQNLIRGAQV